MEFCFNIDVSFLQFLGFFSVSTYIRVPAWPVTAHAHAQSPVSGVRLTAAVETMNGRTETAINTHPE